ncbi:hypothetical protein [Streptomyces sp. NPDC046832]|uniref:hypothetical protein n=1 Tax=Streptomyces sp. NPDC046832 TaxID=3155020 RepID=UPI0033C8ED43
MIAGHWRLLTELGAVPRVLVWDKEGAVGSWRSGGPQLTDDFAAFAGLLGVKFLLCRPRDPEGEDVRSAWVGQVTAVYWINRPVGRLYIVDVVWLG